MLPFNQARSFLLSTFAVFLKFSVVTLELVERRLKKLLLYLNLDICFEKVFHQNSENGSTNDSLSLPHTPTAAKRAKRMKLFVDISFSPGGSSKVLNVSTKDVMDETVPSLMSRILSKFGVTLLSVLQRMKRLAINTMINEGDEGSPNNNSCRRTISPRRRVSQCQKLLPEFPFKFLGLKSGPNPAIVVPSSIQNGEKSSVNKNRSQSMEKRKRSECSSSSEEEQFTCADECEVLPTDFEKGEINLVPGDRVQPASEDNEEDNQNEGSDASTSSQDIFVSPMSETRQMLEAVAEDNYEDAEDPDFVIDPNALHSYSSSSNSEDSYVSENEGLHQELEELQREHEENSQDDLEKQNEDLAPENLHNAIAANPSPNPPEEVEHHNEVEYTNGQASIRELISRNQSQALPEINLQLNKAEPDI